MFTVATSVKPAILAWPPALTAARGERRKRRAAECAAARDTLTADGLARRSPRFAAIGARDSPGQAPPDSPPPASGSAPVYRAEGVGPAAPPSTRARDPADLRPDSPEE